MLARVNRVTRPEEFRSVVRRGRRVVTPSAIYFTLIREPEGPARFGFIVSKEIGTAVTRNTVRRRLRALARGLVAAGFEGSDVVVRVRPGAGDRSWDSLSADMHHALASGHP